MHQGIYEEQIKEKDKVLPMDARVLKWGTVFTGILTVLVCICLYYFPDMHAQEVLAAEKVFQGEGMDAEVRYPAVSGSVVEEEELGERLRIALPEHLSEQQVRIENDYLTQTVYVRFANGVDDYFANYKVRGSSDHIASLSYYREGEEGVLALGLNAVYELEEEYRNGNLYLNLIDPHDIYDKVVVVDAGHGGRAPGAVKNGVSEKQIDLQILLALKEIFDESDDNIRVYYTRTSDMNPTLDERVQLANRSHADLFVSIHNNSSASGNFNNTNGTQVLYSESDVSKLSSRRFAQICLANVTAALDSRRIGLMRGDNIYIIRTSEVPVALIEVGFMTNYKELDKLRSESYQKKAAEGIYRAIYQAFEEGY